MEKTSLETAIREKIETFVDSVGLRIYDIDASPNLVKITVETGSGSPADIDLIAKTHLKINSILEDGQLISLDRAAIEVSSPGLERNLRTLEHFRDALGASVSIRLKPGSHEDRRLSGQITEVREDSVSVKTTSLGNHESNTVTIAFEDIEKAKTVFVWEDSLGDSKSKTRVGKSTQDLISPAIGGSKG
ncbi:MAG: hypothetical protein HKL80_11940 [Acidimicrobiales bacterium]|nr:hypothetical protein [Acidimicrobiales bacterium]